MENSNYQDFDAEITKVSFLPNCPPLLETFKLDLEARSSICSYGELSV